MSDSEKPIGSQYFEDDLETLGRIYYPQGVPDIHLGMKVGTILILSFAVTKKVLFMFPISLRMKKFMKYLHGLES